MGYTHYWRRKKNLDKIAFYKWAADVQCLMENLPGKSESAGGYFEEYPLVIRGWDGTGLPVINPETISFNGDDEDGNGLAHETFLVERDYEPSEWSRPEKGKYFQFCKTDRKPYDLLVCAALIRLKHHFGNAVAVSSDGRAEDWKPALELCRQLFGEAELSSDIRPENP